MSGALSVNGANVNSSLAPEEMEDTSWDQLNDPLDQDLNIQDSGLSNFQKQNPLSQKIKEIETRLSSYHLDPEKEKHYHDILEEASRYISVADQFESQNKTAQATTLEKDAEQKYEEVLSDLGPATAEDAGSLGSVDSLSKEDRLALADKIDQAANKIGYVKYDIKKETNGWQTAFSIMFLGWGVYEDIHVNAKTTKPYTVGYYNVEKHEDALNAFGAGDQSNASGGDHSHTEGDEIDERKYKRLEKQQKNEAEAAQRVLKSMAEALRENDPAKRTKIWADATTTLSNQNIGAIAESETGVYNATQLAFNALIGEVGESSLAKALKTQAISKDFAEKFSQLLQTQSKDVKEEFKDKENAYFRGGNGWDNMKSSNFLRENSDPSSVDGEDPSPSSSETASPPADSKSASDSSGSSQGDHSEKS